MNKLVNRIIDWYQRQGAILLKSAIPFPEYGCRFYPTCSEYTRLSIRKYGFPKGIVKGLWRLLRCNPLTKGGEDLP